MKCLVVRSVDLGFNVLNATYGAKVCGIPALVGQLRFLSRFSWPCLASQGFTVLAFPSDQFYNQEPGDNDVRSCLKSREKTRFCCATHWKVSSSWYPQEILNCLKYARPGGGYVPSFPIFQKTEVNGLTNVHPIFPYLKASSVLLGCFGWLL
jgi:glutathione peroxidase-family protein